MILIGSKAIKHHFPDFPREPKDTDYITHEYEQFDKFPEVNQPKDGTRIEYLKNKVISDLFENGKEYILEPNLLYTLKMSHLFWDVNWEKHMFDVQFLKSKGCIFDKNLFYKLYNYWNKVHSKNKRSDLKMTSEDFFDNALKSEHSHDYLHTLLQDPPTYTKILVGEVEVSEEKFNSLSFEEKCSLVTEEVMIMAFERYWKLDYRVAYSMMLKKFIISHAPLWEATFIIENFIALHKPKFNYFKHLNDGLQRAKQIA